MTNDTIRNKIKALLNRTVSRGCTEAEAIEAASKAAALMREHGLDQHTLLMTEKGKPTKSASTSIRARLWPVIASVTNTAAITSTTPNGREISFTGAEPWPDVAVYLFDVCNTVIDSELKKFRTGEFYRRRRSAKTKRQAADDFTLGLVRRLRLRLFELFSETISEQATTLAQQERDRRYPESRSVKLKQHKSRFDAAEGAGWRAGADAHLSRGVGQERSEQLLIGGWTE
ncbi:DUF7168 domain-containing protein [Rhizobium sp. 9140]|uniref:DUF7168 domain-containing protein n=1 Tax=Rhizobium sp. 9140 TaxID=1761900 RepID=UPI00079A92BB|nr:DUF2786 domain-containing protein [Rhizobium sp. 9140]CZT36383.1 Protein of unknown function (DUF2786) [Rhizobium sp. 9140]